MILAFKLKDFDKGACKVVRIFQKASKTDWSIHAHPFSHVGLKQRKELFVMHVEPSFPNFFFYGLAYFWFCIIMAFPIWALIPGVLMMIEGLAFFPGTYWMVLWLALRKFKSKSKIKLVNYERALELWLWDR